jgi:hypothetical protein
LFAAGFYFWFRSHQPDDPNRLSDIEPIREERAPRTAAAPPVSGKVKGKKK